MPLPGAGLEGPPTGPGVQLGLPAFQSAPPHIHHSFPLMTNPGCHAHPLTFTSADDGSCEGPSSLREPGPGAPRDGIRLAAPIWRDPAIFRDAACNRALTPIQMGPQMGVRH